MCRPTRLALPLAVQAPHHVQLRDQGKRCMLLRRLHASSSGVTAE